MGLLTSEQAQQILDNSKDSGNSRLKIKNDDVFYTWRIISRLFSFEYTFDSRIDALGLTDLSTVTDVETAAKAFFETQTFKGTNPVGIATSF